MSIANIHNIYQKGELLESQAQPDPHQQFRQWFEQALNEAVREPTAMVLATANARGQPSARIVLLKAYDKHGYVFYTNYESRKGHDLSANPMASLLFFWPELERQIRIEGRISKVSAEESNAYFASRPLDSRIGAWASPQSRPIKHDDLASKAAQLANELGDEPPRPEYWGGYRLEAARFEFWQGRPSRLHDRLVYEPKADGAWQITRIAP